MADSYHESVMDAVAAMVVAEGMPGITADRVYVRKTADKATVTLPCVIVDLEGCKETLLPIDTENDVRTLPVNVHLMHRADLRDHRAALVKWLAWKENLHEAFLMQLPSDVSEVWHVDVEPLEVIDVARLVGPEMQAAASSILLKPQVITTRRRA